jgi:hypothetical protein
LQTNSSSTDGRWKKILAQKKSQAQRPGRAQRRRGVRKSPPSATIQCARAPKKAKSSAAARPSATEKGVREYSDYETTQHAHEQKKAKRGGQAVRCENGARGSLQATAIPLARILRWPSRALRPGRAQRRRGFRGPSLNTTQQSTPASRRTSSTAARQSAAEKEGPGSSPATTQHSTPTKRRNPSAAARPSAAKKGDSGLLRLRQSNSHARRRRPTRAQRPGRAQRRRKVQGSPRLRRSNSRVRRRRPNRVQRQSRKQRRRGFGGLPVGVSPGCDTTQHAHAQKKAMYSG